MTREDIALQLFCAYLSREQHTIDLYPDLGEKQIRVAFLLADTFIKVRDGQQASNQPSPLRECRTCKAHLEPRQTMCPHCGTRKEEPER